MLPKMNPPYRQKGKATRSPSSGATVSSMEIQCQFSPFTRALRPLISCKCAEKGKNLRERDGRGVVSGWALTAAALLLPAAVPGDRFE